MIRRYGEQVRRGQRYRLRTGVYAILEQGGALLLTCKEDDPTDIQLPGGGVDAGESTLQALHREVFEETGWRIAAPRRLGAFRRFGAGQEPTVNQLELTPLEMVIVTVNSKHREESLGRRKFGMKFWSSLSTDHDETGSAKLLPFKRK